MKMRKGFTQHHKSSTTSVVRDKNGAGFTLVEILVVVGILGIVAVIGANMFFSILKGSTKTRVLVEVKQNGNYALGVMKRMIRNAKSSSGGGTSITIVNPDDGSTTFSCEDIGGKLKIASEGASLISDKVVVENCTNVFGHTPGESGVKPDVITINFVLMQAEGTRTEETARVDFETTVTLRNY